MSSYPPLCSIIFLHKGDVNVWWVLFSGGVVVESPLYELLILYDRYYLRIQYDS